MSDECATDSSTIINYEKCEVRGIIPYLLFEGKSAAEIHPMLVVACLQFKRDK